MGHFEDRERAQMCDEIAAYFKEEHDLELGVIGTDRILDFFQEMLGDRIYNNAIKKVKLFWGIKITLLFGCLFFEMEKGSFGRYCIAE